MTNDEGRMTNQIATIRDRNGGDGRKHVVVVGGGLAGMACAVALGERGLRVTLVESRFALGGRAGSFEDADREGELLDNCQHVLLGCCTNLMDLYRRLGVQRKIAFHKQVYFLNGVGKRFALGGMGAAGAVSFGAVVCFVWCADARERVAMARAMMAMLRMGKSGREELEGVAFGRWLEKLRQPASLIHKFYDPVLISALNEETRKVSAKYAIQVFQDAMLANAKGYWVGLPACALGELYANVPGVEVRLNTRVEELLFGIGNSKLETRNSITVGVKLRSGAELRADAVVVATNHHAVQRWVPAALRASDARFGGLERLESVPILGAHLWFDRPVMNEEAVALIEGPLQWLFRKDTEGRALHGVISAARDGKACQRTTRCRNLRGRCGVCFPRRERRNCSAE